MRDDVDLPKFCKGSCAHAGGRMTMFDSLIDSNLFELQFNASLGSVGSGVSVPARVVHLGTCQAEHAGPDPRPVTSWARVWHQIEA